jgi:ribosomal protein S18 acetylase RimI-like enzyme
VVIRHENEASKSLYKKLGFEKLFDMARIVFTPFEYEDGKRAAVASDEHDKGSHLNSSARHNGVNNHNV